MASPAPGTSNLTALFQNASISGNAEFVRCPAEALHRLRHLNDAEVVTLFTPFVPHPPGTALAKNMDPFEPLGRSLPRQVRHVPYRLDHGWTKTHSDFLSASGAIVIVVCSTENVLNHDSQAFARQTKFAQNAASKIRENRSLVGVPVVLLLVSNGSARQAHEYAVRDFPALVTVDDYSTPALVNAVRVMFGQ